MNFLITGAYGFVGTNLCKYLDGHGHDCMALDVPAAIRDDVPYSRCFDWDRLDQLPPCDVVVHLAGKAHDLRKVASEQSYFDVNVGLTQKIYERLRKEAGVGNGRKVTFIYFSSSKAAADGNAYGRSKWAAEQYLLSTPAPGLNLCILRPAMIHGPGNKGNLNLLWGLAKRGFPWPLAAFENKRSFTSIGNICAAVEAIATSDKLQHPPRPSFPAFSIADDEMLSTNRLIELIAETCGRKARLWRVPQGLMRLAARIGDVLHLPITAERLQKLTEDSFVDNSELKKVLGWSKMPIRAEAGMRQTLASFREV